MKQEADNDSTVRVNDLLKKRGCAFYLIYYQFVLIYIYYSRWTIYTSVESDPITEKMNVVLQ